MYPVNCNSAIATNAQAVCRLMYSTLRISCSKRAVFCAVLDAAENTESSAGCNAQEDHNQHMRAGLGLRADSKKLHKQHE